MFYRKSGMPEDDELVLCTITKIHFNSVFALLDEYDKTGMIHISEIAPGRIRNIRDYVQEGKKVICKVLKTDKIKGHIDLSLRRVNEGQRRKKNEEIKAEQKAEKIIEGLSKFLKLKASEVYDEVATHAFKKYEYLHQCFRDVAEKGTDLEKLGIRKEIAEPLAAAIKEKIKPPRVEIKAEMKLVSYESNGIEIIKKAIEKGKGDNIKIRYGGAGKYIMHVDAPDYKSAEKMLKHSSEAIIKFMEKNKGIAEFKREE